MTERTLKRELRKQAVAARAEAVRHVDRGAAAAAVRDRFITQFSPRPGTAVSAFWPVGDELDIRPTIEALHRCGCVVGLPVVTVKHMPLTFRVWEPGVRFIVSAFGIPEPGPDRPPVTPDISIVPLLAFDADGYRLGYGGGYYDRTLQQMRLLRRHPPYLAIGVGYAAQQVDRLPREPFDQPLDGIVTEDYFKAFAQPVRAA